MRILNYLSNKIAIMKSVLLFSEFIMIKYFRLYLSVFVLFIFAPSAVKACLNALTPQQIRELKTYITDDTSLAIKDAVYSKFCRKNTSQSSFNASVIYAALVVGVGEEKKTLAKACQENDSTFILNNVRRFSIEFLPDSVTKWFEKSCGGVSLRTKALRDGSVEVHAIYHRRPGDETFAKISSFSSSGGGLNCKNFQKGKVILEGDTGIKEVCARNRTFEGKELSVALTVKIKGANLYNESANSYILPSKNIPLRYQIKDHKCYLKGTQISMGPLPDGSGHLRGIGSCHLVYGDRLTATYGLNAKINFDTWSYKINPSNTGQFVCTRNNKRISGGGEVISGAEKPQDWIHCNSPGFGLCGNGPAIRHYCAGLHEVNGL